AGIEADAPATPERLEQIRSALQGTDLLYAGGHSSIKQLADLAAVESLASSVASLGGGFLLVSGRFDTLEEYRAGADTLNQAGARCREAGVRLCYHNHAWEFSQTDGRRPIDLLIAETDPDLVSFCPDVYWVHVGGDDPADFISRHRDRCPYFHFKDGLGGDQTREFRELGRGCMELKAALDAALSVGPEWIVVEQDSTRRDPAQSSRISREYLRTLGV
ncbi:MAG: sugar phosphate isomerase/epimerase, partial [Armatimonadota bacterium]